MRVLSALILLVLCVGCSESSPEPSVKIAVSAPLDNGDVRRMVEALEIALDDAGGRAGPWAVELEFFDTSASAATGPSAEELERRAAAAAAADPAVVVYLGSPFTSLTRVSLPLTNAVGLPQVSPTASWPGLTQPGFAPAEPAIYYPSGERTFFRLIPPDDIQGMEAARWARELGAETVFVVDSGTQYGFGTAGIFEAAARDLGLEIVGRTSLRVAAGDALFEQLDAASPDLLFFGGTLSEGGLGLIRGLRRHGSKMPVLGSDGLVGELASAGLPQEWSGGIFATSPGLPLVESERLRRLRQRFEDEGLGPLLPSAVRSYEALGAVLAAISRASAPTRQAVLDSLTSLGSYDGVLGSWSFDEAGDISLRDVDRMSFEDGRWRLAEAASSR